MVILFYRLITLSPLSILQMTWSHPCIFSSTLLYVTFTLSNFPLQVVPDLNTGCQGGPIWDRLKHSHQFSLHLLLSVSGSHVMLREKDCFLSSFTYRLFGPKCRMLYLLYSSLSYLNIWIIDECCKILLVPDSFSFPICRRRAVM